MIRRNAKGKLYIDPWESRFKEEDVVMRMHAMLNLVRNQDESRVDFADVQYAMDIIEDMIPSVEQAQVYLTPDEKIRILSDTKE